MKVVSRTDAARSARVLTMPHMGLFSRVFFKYLFSSFGLEVVLTPRLSEETIREGVALSGEQFCMPLKITMGDIKRGLEMGAQAVAYTANCGPCRFGRYWDVTQQRLEQELGREIPFLLIKHGHELSSVYEMLGVMGIQVGREDYMEVMGRAACKLDQLILVEDKLADVNARAHNRAAVKAAFDRWLPAIEAAHTVDEMETTSRAVFAELDALEQEPEPLARVLIVGEIYEVVEPAANLEMVAKLGSLGVAAKRALSYNEQVSFRKAWPFSSRWRIFDDPETAREVHRDFLDCMSTVVYFGGYGRNSLCFAKIARKMGFDGLIHVLPFTCMPEIIAKPFIERFARDQDLPLLSMIVDEHFAEEGFDTRLEAFVDMVIARRQRRMA